MSGPLVGQGKYDSLSIKINWKQTETRDHISDRGVLLGKRLTRESGLCNHRLDWLQTSVGNVTARPWRSFDGRCDQLQVTSLKDQTKLILALRTGSIDAEALHRIDFG